MKSATLIIATYNWPVALDRVLSSAARQYVQPERIIVADDGSGQETFEVVQRWSQRLGQQLVHSWQPDDGFRLAASRNRAVTHARGDVLIFVDGDCLLRPGLVAEHLRLAERGYCVAGNRLLLSQRLTQQVVRGDEDPVQWSRARWLQARWAGDVGRLVPLLRLPGHSWRRIGARRWLRLRGCNFSMRREDFERVNGFEEKFSGWGFEDSDIAIRLMATGVGIKSGRFSTGVLHLWHAEQPRDKAELNRQRALTALREGRVCAELGYSQYVGPSRTVSTRPARCCGDAHNIAPTAAGTGSSVAVRAGSAAGAVLPIEGDGDVLSQERSA